jgi:hypothetical protein
VPQPFKLKGSTSLASATNLEQLHDLMDAITLELNCFERALNLASA